MPAKRYTRKDWTEISRLPAGTKFEYVYPSGKTEMLVKDATDDAYSGYGERKDYHFPLRVLDAATFNILTNDERDAERAEYDRRNPGKALTAEILGLVGGGGLAGLGVKAGLKAAGKKAAPKITKGLTERTAKKAGDNLTLRGAKFASRTLPESVTAGALYEAGKGNWKDPVKDLGRGALYGSSANLLFPAGGAVGDVGKVLKKPVGKGVEKFTQTGVGGVVADTLGGAVGQLGRWGASVIPGATQKIDEYGVSQAIIDSLKKQGVHPNRIKSLKAQYDSNVMKSRNDYALDLMERAKTLNPAARESWINAKLKAFDEGRTLNTLDEIDRMRAATAHTLGETGTQYLHKAKRRPLSQIVGSKPLARVEAQMKARLDDTSRSKFELANKRSRETLESTLSNKILGGSKELRRNKRVYEKSPFNNKLENSSAFIRDSVNKYGDDFNKIVDDILSTRAQATGADTAKRRLDEFKKLIGGNSQGDLRLESALKQWVSRNAIDKKEGVITPQSFRSLIDRRWGASYKEPRGESNKLLKNLYTENEINNIGSVLDDLKTIREMANPEIVDYTEGGVSAIWDTIARILGAKAGATVADSGSAGVSLQAAQIGASTTRRILRTITNMNDDVTRRVLEDPDYAAKLISKGYNSDGISKFLIEEYRNAIRQKFGNILPELGDTAKLTGTLPLRPPLHDLGNQFINNEEAR